MAIQTRGDESMNECAKQTLNRLPKKVAIALWYTADTFTRQEKLHTAECCILASLGLLHTAE